MNEGKDARSLDESRRIGEPKIEAGRGEAIDQFSAVATGEIHGDVHIGAEAGHSVENGRLRAEQEPAHAQPGKGTLEVGEQLSDWQRRGRHPRRGRSAV